MLHGVHGQSCFCHMLDLTDLQVFVSHSHRASLIYSTYTALAVSESSLQITVSNCFSVNAFGVEFRKLPNFLVILMSCSA